MKKIPTKKTKEDFTDRQVTKMLADYDEKTDERYGWAQRIMEGQPKETREIVGGMVEVMQRMAGDPIATLYVNGKNQRVRIPDMIQERNFYYFAVRMLLACARMDIQIAGFTEPKVKCVEDGKEP